MNSRQDSSRTRNRLMLVGLALLFTAPWAIAWWMINYTDVGRSGDPATPGELIEPPLPLPDLGLVDPSDGESSARLHGRWTLLYRTDTRCERECEYALYEMRQLRLAMGKHAPRVQRVLIVGTPVEDVLSDAQVSEFRGQFILPLGNRGVGDLDVFEEERAPRSGRLYIVDPLGNLMISYSQETDPREIIKDLERLIRYSHIG